MSTPESGVDKKVVKTKPEILQETLEFYSQDPARRAYNEGVCYYLKIDEDGIKRRCSVGRCLSKEAKYNGGINRHPNGVKDLATNFGENNIDNLLAPEYHGHDVDFWASLQDLHDLTFNWTATGLSEEGVKSVEHVCDQHDIDIEEISFEKVNVDR